MNRADVDTTPDVPIEVQVDGQAEGLADDDLSGVYRRLYPSLVRTATTLQPGFVYDSADIAADFGAPPDEIDVTVRQLSLAAGWGIPATRRLSLL